MGSDSPWGRADWIQARREIISAAEHFSMIRASRNKSGAAFGVAPALPGQVTIRVRLFCFALRRMNQSCLVCSVLLPVNRDENREGPESSWLTHTFYQLFLEKKRTDEN